MEYGKHKGKEKNNQKESIFFFEWPYFHGDVNSVGQHTVSLLYTHLQFQLHIGILVSFHILIIV